MRTWGLTTDTDQRSNPYISSLWAAPTWMERPRVAPKEAKYRPAASLITVTDDGVAGRERDHFTFTAPTFGRFSRPALSMCQRALAVNRID